MSINHTEPSTTLESSALETPANSAPPKITSLLDLDPDILPEENKQCGRDWFAILNPELTPAFNIDLVGSLDHESAVCCVCFSSNGKYLATSCNHTAQIYDVTTFKKICVFHSDSAVEADELYVRTVCFSPEGKYLVTGADDGLIRIWDIENRALFCELQGHEKEVSSIDFSKDGKTLVSGSKDGTVRIWDMENKKILLKLEVDDEDTEFNSISLSPNGYYVAAGASNSLVYVWDARTGQLLKVFNEHRMGIFSVAFSPDGKILCSGSLDETIKIWDLSSLTSDDKFCQERSACCGTLVGHKDFVLSVACSPCSRWVFSGSKDRSIHCWDSHTGQLLFVIMGHRNSVMTVAHSPVGRLIASGSGANRARVWRY